MNYSIQDLVRNVTIAGITVATAFIGSRLVLANAAYDSEWREGAWQVITTSSWLVLLWAVAGAILALVRWRSTTVMFRVVLMVNAGMTLFLVSEFMMIR
jgi:hypothetical protein